MTLLFRVLIWILPVLTSVVPLWLSAQDDGIVVVGSIEINGNKVTRPGIVLRELPFTSGDTLTQNQLALRLLEARENLLKLPLFHFVDISTSASATSAVRDVTVNLTERWYIWVWPVFDLSDRNFNSWLQQGDFTRVSYGLFLQQENFRGRLEKLHVKIRLGYQQESSLLYELPYLNKRKTTGAGMMLNYSRQRELGYLTVNNKLEYHRADEFLMESLDAAFFLRLRPDIHFSHTWQAGFHRYAVSEKLLQLNPEYTAGSAKLVRFAEFSYLLKEDFRDQRSYPLAGIYAEGLVSKQLPFEESDPAFFSVKMLLRGYIPLQKKWNLAGSFASRIVSAGKLPFHLSRALGYGRDYVRGYEYYVVDGGDFAVAKINLRYCLLGPSVVNIRWLRATQFNAVPYAVYPGVFLDGGRVWGIRKSPENPLNGKFLAGAGLGVDFVTYYDKVFRVEYTLNAEGESGFFLHFMAAI
jgi:outer membrane protein assembly factor BamA